MNVVSVLKIENTPDICGELRVKTGINGDVSSIDVKRIIHNGPDGFIGGFLRKYGSDLVGQPVEEVLHNFVDYLENQELE